MKNKTIISTIGTSLLTNKARNNETLKETANFKQEEMSDSAIGLIDNLSIEIKEELLGLSNEELRKKSAELNGILGIYNGVFPEKNFDNHILIATDTYQGLVTAKILESFLQSKGFHSVIIKQPKNLSTKNKKHFDSGIKDLLKWFDDTDSDFNSYRKQSSEIIFNLTGSFKALQGYLNTAGMFYADKLVYIFETGNELIEIPKFPIKIDTDKLSNFSLELALMAQELELERSKINNIPEIMLEEIGENNFILSHWGDLLWNNMKGDILSDNLLNFPHISYEKSFHKDFENERQVDKKVKLQEVLAKVSKILTENNGDVGKLKGDGGVLYENYKNHYVNGQPLGHFRVNNSLRISCIKKESNIVLRYYGTHEHVETNEGIK